MIRDGHPFRGKRRGIACFAGERGLCPLYGVRCQPWHPFRGKWKGTC